MSGSGQFLLALDRQHAVGTLIVEVLAIRRGRSPLILGDLDPPAGQSAHRRADLTPHSTAKSQILRLGEDRAESLTPWLDELVALSIEGRPVENFYRMQALWFSITHVVAPFIKTSPVRTSLTQRARAWPTQPRHRRFAPLRQEARKAAELLRADLVRRWSVTELADELHLSKSQVGRVFVEAFGKSPIAYLTMLRVERMAGLLRTTDAPIAVIAREVGWRDPDFAARQFRRCVGTTPSGYRALSRVQASPATG